MAERQGGMRRPRNPAPVSGPGQLSQRTDGGPQQVQADMSGMPYGENQAMESLQSMAPMSASPSAGSPRMRARQAAAQGGGINATPLMSPTRRPNEPVTAGSAVGPGDGPSIQPNAMQQAAADAAIIAKYLPDLMSIAEQPDTPTGFKRFVRYVRNMQGA